MWEHVRNSGSPRISLNQNLVVRPRIWVSNASPDDSDACPHLKTYSVLLQAGAADHRHRNHLASQHEGSVSGPSLSSHPLRCSEGKGSILHFPQAFPGEANACYIKSCLQGLTPARPLKMFQCPNTEAVWVISMPQAISTWLITCVEAVTWLIQVDTILEVP